MGKRKIASHVIIKKTPKKIHIYAKVSNNIIYINTMKKIALILLVLLPAFAKADFKTLSTEQVRDKIKQGLVIIDVRRQDEYEQYGVIPNAHKLTFFDKNGKYNIERWLRDLSKIVPNKDTPFVLVCAHASRTKIIGRFLDKKTAYQNIFELDGGINRGWIDKGLATTKIAANQGKPWYKIW
jgi:rhodanese-related sulfurtransferase